MKPVTDYRPIHGVSAEVSEAFYLEASKLILYGHPSKAGGHFFLSAARIKVVEAVASNPDMAIIRKLSRLQLGRCLVRFFRENGYYVSGQVSIRDSAQRLVFRTEEDCRNYVAGYKKAILEGGYKGRATYEASMLDDLENN